LSEHKLDPKKQIFFRNRNRLEIVAELLDNAKNEAPKMRIIYAARISHRLGSTYIDHLLRERLLEEFFVEKNRRVYRVSQQGIKFLELYESLKEIAFGHPSQIPLQKDSLEQATLPSHVNEVHLVVLAS
jgi:predicted transcriptional regulator